MHPTIRILGVTTATLALCTSVNAATQNTKQMSFSSPEEAVTTFVSSIKADDKDKLIQIFGTEAKPLVESGDAIEDKANRELFLKAYNNANKLEKVSDTKFILTIGKDNWQFPIPLVQEANSWHFDTDSGKEEILNRRIGRNEISVMKALLAYVDAQHDYYLSNPQQDKQLSYAQKFQSTLNTHDGLYYPVKSGETPSPLGEFYAKAHSEGHDANSESKQPYYGYFYRILKSQGPDAKGGAYDYLVQGKMIGGHALIAWPATYGNTGMMTFIVNQEGKIYEKDLGANTQVDVEKITTFNPDKTWKMVKEAN
ncbi:DUF2950 family protein [Candidatus Berkiella aquae]|uniref:DUF2950 domain-containing protein n=1 Tax=Candidatus Berkiella aquae TaxID=295108 RepID=A0A0Q9YVT3_9GAMM|nr:DUF2950 domain-containing protein [Candidatus Berkiella aquae]MCS5711539.1 DUF2950 domain-containing protein [Candidatus Berkiella aquae]